MKKATLSRLARRGLLLCAFSLLTTGLLMGYARAQAASSLERLGTHLQSDLLLLLRAQLPTQSHRGISASTSLHLNGMRLLIQSASFNREQVTTESVLEQLENHCQSPQAAAGSLALPIPQLTERNDDRADFFCFKPSNDWTMNGLMAAVQDFSQSGDITQLGKPLAAHIVESDDAVSLLSIEIAGPFVPQKIFPLHHDAPGEDHPELPRPTGIRRLSVGQEEGPLLTAYADPDPAAERLTRYTRQLRATGAKVVTPPSEVGDSLTRLVQKDTERFIVSALDHEGESSLIIARLPH